MCHSSFDSSHNSSNAQSYQWLSPLTPPQATLGHRMGFILVNVAPGGGALVSLVEIPDLLPTVRMVFSTYALGWGFTPKCTQEVEERAAAK